MALIDRLARVLRADLHAVLDRIEEPEALLRQALRDMDEALAGERQRLAALVAEGEHVAARSTLLAEEIATAAVEVERALDGAREDLARTALRRRLLREAEQRSLAQRARELAREREELQASLAQRELQLEAMQHKAALLATGMGPNDGARGAVREEDIDLALLAARERRAAR